MFTRIIESAIISEDRLLSTVKPNDAGEIVVNLLDRFLSSKSGAYNYANIETVVSEYVYKRYQEIFNRLKNEGKTVEDFKKAIRAYMNQAVLAANQMALEQQNKEVTNKDNKSVEVEQEDAGSGIEDQFVVPDQVQQAWISVQPKWIKQMQGSLEKSIDIFDKVVDIVNNFPKVAKEQLPIYPEFENQLNELYNIVRQGNSDKVIKNTLQNFNKIFDIYDITPMVSKEQVDEGKLKELQDVNTQEQESLMPEQSFIEQEEKEKRQEIRKRLKDLSPEEKAQYLQQINKDKKVVTIQQKQQETMKVINNDFMPEIQQIYPYIHDMMVNQIYKQEKLIEKLPIENIKVMSESEKKALEIVYTTLLDSRFALLLGTYYKSKTDDSFKKDKVDSYTLFFKRLQDKENELVQHNKIDSETKEKLDDFMDNLTNAFTDINNKSAIYQETMRQMYPNIQNAGQLTSEQDSKIKQSILYNNPTATQYSRATLWRNINRITDIYVRGGLFKERMSRLYPNVNNANELTSEQIEHIKDDIKKSILYQDPSTIPVEVLRDWKGLGIDTMYSKNDFSYTPKEFQGNKLLPEEMVEREKYVAYLKEQYNTLSPKERKQLIEQKLQEFDKQKLLSRKAPVSLDFATEEARQRDKRLIHLPEIQRIDNEIQQLSIELVNKRKALENTINNQELQINKPMTYRDLQNKFKVDIMEISKEIRFLNQQKQQILEKMKSMDPLYRSTIAKTMIEYYMRRAEKLDYQNRFIEASAYDKKIQDLIYGI